MDGNRDAAERCVEFARAALDAGDADKAMRLLLKSQRLYPLDEVGCERLVLVDEMSCLGYKHNIRSTRLR